MTDLRKAAEMALEYLEYLNELDIAGLDHEVHTNALRQALAQDHGFDRTASHMAGEYVDTNWDTSDMAHRTGGLSMDQENEAYGYAKRLAQAIWEKYYKEESPDWKPKNDVLGVLTQIDNMTCGLEKAQPEQEPVAWRWLYNGKPDSHKCFDGKGPDADVILRAASSVMPRTVQYFYTAPPSKPWVSLTDEEIGLLSTNNTFSGMHPDYLRECFRAIEAKLKEKNNG